LTFEGAIMDDIFFDSESDQQGIPVITGPTLTGSSRDDIFTVSEGDTFVILGGDGIDTVQVLTNEIFINGIGLSSGPVFDSTQSLFGITNGVTELRFDSIERLELLVQHVFVTNRPGTNIPFTPTDADNILATLYQVGTASEDIIDLQGEDVFFFLEVHAGAGDDLIIGPDLSGVGIDTAVFNGSFDSYIIIPSAHGSFIITDTIGSDGEDTLHNIEFLEFSDQQIVATELFANEQASMGDDILVGSNDLDSLFGQRGNDILTGGEGDLW